jgi:hypothetical protein
VKLRARSGQHGKQDPAPCQAGKAVRYQYYTPHKSHVGSPVLVRRSTAPAAVHRDGAGTHRGLPGAPWTLACLSGHIRESAERTVECD